MFDPNFLGKNGFFWFIGVVEDRMDPLKLGRVRVRPFGWNTENKQETSTESLPWATVMAPTTDASNSGVGTNSKLLEGSWVIGFFMDGNECQRPIVMGSLPGLQARPANSNVGFSDPRKTFENPVPVSEAEFEVGSPVIITNEESKSYPRYNNEPGTSRLARGENLEQTINPQREAHRAIHQEIPTSNHTAAEGSDSEIPGGEFSEPELPYATQYPYNQVIQTEAGHVIELDDTPGAERINIFHRSGSNVEIHPDGKVVQHKSNDSYDLMDTNEFVHVGATSNKTVQRQMRLKIVSEGLVVEAADKMSITVHGNCNLKVDGDVNELVDGNVNRHVHGNIIETVEGDIQRTVNGSVNEVVNGSVTETFNTSLVQNVSTSITITSGGPQVYQGSTIDLN